jgi:transcription elongation GreA/GreB family factor
MSVAFRRESDEEHKEPRFEVALPPGPNFVTKRGHALIQSRHDALDLELQAAPTAERREELLRDLRYWRSRLATAQRAPDPSGETVTIGTRVTIEQDGRTRALEIVGHDESEPACGRVAFSAPLAQALLGSEVGDEVPLPGQQRTMRVIAIEVRVD